MKKNYTKTILLNVNGCLLEFTKEEIASIVKQFSGIKDFKRICKAYLGVSYDIFLRTFETGKNRKLKKEVAERIAKMFTKILNDITFYSNLSDIIIKYKSCSEKQ